jgi:ribonucleoside-triphosphate reductase
VKDRFQLDDDFISEYVGRTVDWGPLGELTYRRTYARELNKVPARIAQLGRVHNLVRDPGSALEGSYEEWWLTCVRVIEGMYTVQKMHCAGIKLPWSEQKAQRSAQEAFEGLYTFLWTPPGRGLYMMGTEYIYENGGAALNNCGFTTTEHDLVEAMCFLMDMSMLGVGVGFDTLGKYQYKAGPVRFDSVTIQIEDSREGWVEALRHCLQWHLGWDVAMPLFDYSLLRAEGEPIKGFGGTSSGPGPLKNMIEKLILLFFNSERVLTSTDIVDIANIIGECVVSGNVRRSAEIALGSPSDEEFLALKDWDSGVPQHRAMSNNSVVIEDRYFDFTNTAEHTATAGEPGYLFIDNARNYSRMGRAPDGRDSRVSGCNPCVEQSLEDKELCCLVETFPARHMVSGDSSDWDVKAADATDYKRTLKFAYMYAKTVTLLHTHYAPTNAVMMRNRRIGCSQTGVVQAIAEVGLQFYLDKYCDEGYETVQNYDKIYSDWLCVPRSIKTTSIKPSGSVSLLPGATSGIHYPIAEHYFKVMRVPKGSTFAHSHRAAGYRVVDLGLQEGIYLPVKVKNFTRGRADVSIWEQAALAAALQEYWADNQVSVTITFTKEEAPDIKRVLEFYATKLKGVAFLPLSDHEYEHAPEQAITEEEYMEYSSKLTGVDWNGAVHEVTDEFCDGDKCEV